MGRPSLPLGTYGVIWTVPQGSRFVSRTRFRDFDGVVRTVKRTGKSQAAAERALRAALVVRQSPVKEAEVTAATKFSKLADMWFTDLERQVDDGRRSPGTLATYRSIYDNYVGPSLGALALREVTTPVADRVLSAVKRKSPSRARTAKIVMSGVMRLAARHGAVVANPIREVGSIESKPKRRPRALTAAERTEWLTAVEKHERARLWDLPDLTRMMLATGCRIGECLAIGWDDLDLDAATVEIRWRLLRYKGIGLVRTPSTKSGEKGERLVPLPRWAVTMLRERRKRIGPSVEPVFPDSIGGWRDPSNVRRVWREVRDELAMTGLVSHTLRKTVASFLDDANVPARKISDQLGHAKVSMTQDLYLGRRLTDRHTAEVLEGMFGGDDDQAGDVATESE